MAAAACVALVGSASAMASTPGADVRLTNDAPTTSGYVSDYTLATGAPYSDATLRECSRSRGRENEPSVAVNPRNRSVMVGSSNDYCGVYNDGEDQFGAPIASGPIWLGYYRSENGGSSFASSLVPGYPDDRSPYAARAHVRTATAGDPVLAWDAQGRLFAGAEASEDPAGSKKTFGDVWVATFVNPGGPGAATINDGKEFQQSVIVARGTSAPNLLGKFQDKTAIEADRTNSACRNNVYFANSRFVGNGGSNIYFYRSTNHGATFSHGTLLTTSVNDVQDPEIAVTANGHVFVTYDATLHRGNRTYDALLYNKWTDCGATFSPARTLTTFNPFAYVDRSAAPPSPHRSGSRTASARTRRTPLPARVATAGTSRRRVPPATPTPASTPPQGRRPTSTPRPRTRPCTWCSSRRSPAPRPRPARPSAPARRAPVARAASISCVSTAPPARRRHRS